VTKDCQAGGSAIVQTAKELQKAHVTLERYAGMQQDELSIWNSPSGAKVAWFKDPDGNTLSVTQFDQTGAVP
jgi:hypothetical protein